MTKSTLSTFAHMDESEQTSLQLAPGKVFDSPAPLDASREEGALAIVKTNMFYSMGIVLVPVPLVDLAYSIGIQLNMIRRLSDHYGIAFSNHVAKNLIFSMMGGMGGLFVGRLLFVSVFKLIPGGGPLAALVSNPVASGAVTYALGKIFIMHFEAGGTLLDFDPKRMKNYFFNEFQNGMKVSQTLADQKATKK